MPRALLVTILLSACSQSLGTLSAVSMHPGTVPVATGPRIRGESCGSSLLGLPLGAPSIETAARAAQRRRGSGEDLQDVRVTRTSWTIGVYARECLIVDAAR